MDGYANRLYRNDKTRFVDVAPKNGLDAEGRAIADKPGDHSMAGTIRPDIVDYDNDGAMDLALSARNHYVILILTFLSFSQEIIENPEKPLSKKAGRIVNLKEVLSIQDTGDDYYFKYPYTVQITAKH
jgi:hypothetical protein